MMASCVWYNSSHTLSCARNNVFYSVGNTQGRRKQFFNSQAKVEVDFVLVSTEGAHLQCKLLSEILGECVRDPPTQSTETLRVVCWQNSNYLYHYQMPCALHGHIIVKGISWKYTAERTEVYPTSYATAKIALSGWHSQSETLILSRVCTQGVQEAFFWHFGLRTVRVVITYHHYNSCHRCHWDSSSGVGDTGYLSSGKQKKTSEWG